MEMIKTNIEGLFLIKPFSASDNRGTFVKTFSSSVYKAHGFDLQTMEGYYSTSHQGVVRGMHFQLPPHQHHKLVYVAWGTIFDVVLDLRKDSETYGQHQTFELSHENKYMLAIAPGLAHGFQALTQGAAVFYQVGTEYNPTADAGIKFDSFGCPWPLPVGEMSARDKAFPEFSQFNSPF